MAQGKKTDPKLKESARALSASGVSVNDISRKLGISKYTVYHWLRNDFKNDDEFEKLRTENKENIINKSWQGVNSAIEIILLKLNRAKHSEAEIDSIYKRLESGEVDNAEAEEMKLKLKMLMSESLGDVARVFGVMIDKINVMTGKPTENVSLEISRKFEDM